MLHLLKASALAFVRENTNRDNTNTTRQTQADAQTDKKLPRPSQGPCRQNIDFPSICLRTINKPGRLKKNIRRDFRAIDTYSHRKAERCKKLKISAPITTNSCRLPNIMVLSFRRISFSCLEFMVGLLGRPLTQIRKPFTLKKLNSSARKLIPTIDDVTTFDFHNTNG